MKWIKKFLDWAGSIPQDKLLHDYAGALITLFVFAVSFIWLTFGQAFFVANATALLALFAKELYDNFWGDSKCIEIADIFWGMFGALKVDAALGILLIAL